MRLLKKKKKLEKAGWPSNMAPMLQDPVKQ